MTTNVNLLTTEDFVSIVKSEGLSQSLNENICVSSQMKKLCSFEFHNQSRPYFKKKKFCFILRFDLIPSGSRQLTFDRLGCCILILYQSSLHFVKNKSDVQNGVIIRSGGLKSGLDENLGVILKFWDSGHVGHFFIIQRYFRNFYMLNGP